MPRILLTLIALLAAIAVAAGCGNDGSSSSGAASLAPAGAMIYGEATLDPEDDQQADIDALIEKFPGEGSAGERIRGLLEKAFAESETGLSFKNDIEPWLGDEAGFFVSSVTPGGDGSGAVLVATDDEGEETIEDDAAYNDTLDDAPEERLGFLYFNTPAFVDQMQKSGGGAALGPFE